MEEKGTETNKNKSTNRSNSNLYLFDDAYHKVKAQQKRLRCKSANVHKKIEFNINLKKDLTKRQEEKSKKDNNFNFWRNKFFSNDIIRKKDNTNTIDSQLLSAKSRNNLNSKLKTINLSNLFKSNDSLKLDTTKQTSKRTRILSGKYSSNYSFNKISNSTRKNNKKIFPLRKSNNHYHFSVININADSCGEKEKEKNMIKTTLKDLTIKKLIKKSKTIEIEKMIKSNRNKTSRQRIKFFDFNSTPSNNYLNGEKKYYADKNFMVNEDDFKDNESNMKKNYPIKYSFWDDTMNNIYHIVNFVDMENKEELFQNVIYDFKNDNESKFEDFKTFGHEFSPEFLYKINQDVKQKLIKLKLEELKKQENTNDLKIRKIQRPIFKKKYIPEFKQKFNNPDWKKIPYQSIYKFHSIKYNLTTKKTISNKKKIFNKKFIPKNIGKHNSLIIQPKNTKYFEDIVKEPKKEKKSSSIKIDAIENKKIKSALKDNINKIKNEDYLNKSKEIKNDQINNEPINNDNNKIEESKEENITINNIDKKSSKPIKIDNNENLTSNINESNNISSNNTNIQNYQKIINQKMTFKDYNKMNKIVKIENIFLKGDENYKYENLNISDYVNEINSKRKYQKRNSFTFFKENELKVSSKNLTKKGSASISVNSRDKKNKTYRSKKSAKLTFAKIFDKKNINFKEEEEIIRIINNKKREIKIESEKDKEKEEKKNIPINVKKNIRDIRKQETKNEINEKNNIIKAKKINLEEEKNDEILKKNLFAKIEKENRHHEVHKKKYYKPFHETQREISEVINKIELNFISNKSKFLNRKPKKKTKKIVQENVKEKPVPEKDLIQQESKKEEVKEDIIKKLEEEISKIKSRRTNKSATLEYINNKYKEIEGKKHKVDKKAELTENLDKLKFFKNVNLDSVEDIEYNKNILLYKIKEDIRYKISIGACDKTEMQEYLKFENKLNEYKINYNLRDKDKIREYVLLLLVKFNEFIELLNIRERRKNEENRINKFINNLNYELDYNIPMSLLIKGRKCFSRNLNKNSSSLSEIKNN